MKILITGARGRIGKRLVSRLESEHELRLASRALVEDDERWCQVDVTKLQQVEAACEGVDTIIHLAIATGHEGGFEDDDFNAERWDINAKGTYNLFEAAARSGVRRVIYTSSLTVVWGYPVPEWVSGDAPARPVDTYGLTKYVGEEIARTYANNRGIEVICLRIPAPVDVEDPASRQESILPQWIAYSDLVEAFALSLTAPLARCELVTIVGESSKRRWDLSQAEHLLGYKGRVNLEESGYELREEPADYSRPGSVHGDDPETFRS